jgi:hypothetical protein
VYFLKYTQHSAGHLVINFAATSTPAHSEDGDEVISRNAAKPSYLYLLPVKEICIEL